MSLYLCVFMGNEEVDSVEVGFYSDFNYFRNFVTDIVENGIVGSMCPVLINHSDCDGSWSCEEAGKLIKELNLIENCFRKIPPVDLNSDWKKQTAKQQGIKLENLSDCFFDVNGEPLIDQLRNLAKTSQEVQSPIIFQ